MTQISNPGLHLISCRIGGEEYCLDTAAIAGICRAEMLSRTVVQPGTLGSVPWNKSSVPVFDLAERLRRELPERPPLEFVLVLPAPERSRAEEPYWGLGIDGVSRLIEPGADQFMPFPPGAAPVEGLYKGVIRWADRLIPYVESSSLHPAMTLKEKAAADAAPGAAPTAPTASNRILGYGLPNHAGAATRILVGVPYKQVVKVIERPRIFPVAFAPGHIAGLVEWEHHPLPVADFGYRIGFPKVRLEACDRMLVLRRGREAGFLAAPFAGDLIAVPVAAWPVSEQHEYPRRYVRGVFENNGVTLLIPDFGALASD